MIHDPQNAMDMIRHYYKRIQFHMRKMDRNIQLALFCNPSRVVQLHLSFGYPAKEVRTAVCDDGNEIRPDPGVIIPFQSNATAVVTCGIMMHGLLLGPAGLKTFMHCTEYHPERL
ncbi:MAG: hypothetical protein ACUVS4_03035 [Chloroflexaceae bacterium]